MTNHVQKAVPSASAAVYAAKREERKSEQRQAQAAFARTSKTGARSAERKCRRAPRSEAAKQADTQRTATCRGEDCNATLRTDDRDENAGVARALAGHRCPLRHRHQAAVLHSQQQKRNSAPGHRTQAGHKESQQDGRTKEWLVGARPLLLGPLVHVNTAPTPGLQPTWLALAAAPQTRDRFDFRFNTTELERVSATYRQRASTRKARVRRQSPRSRPNCTTTTQQVSRIVNSQFQ